MATAAGSAHRRARWPAVLLVVLVLLVACSADPAPSPQPTGERSLAGADASRTRAAELRAGLTHLLVERTYVTAASVMAVRAADGSLTAATVADELASLDAGAVALADLLGASYTGARDPLLAALRSTDRLHVAHAVAQTTADPERVRSARDDLVRAQAALAAVLRRVVPRLRAEDVADRLGPDLEAQLAVGGEDPYVLLRVAAARAPDTAELLAGGIAADRGLGLAATRAATLRAQLTALLAEHTLLVGALGSELAAQAPLDGVIAALAGNGRALTAVVGSDYPAAREALSTSWQDHVDAVVGFAQARVGGSAEAEKRSVLAYGAALSQLLAEIVPGLPVGTMTMELAPGLDARVRALEAAIDRSPDAPAVLREATAAAPAPAALLAAAIAEDLRLT